MKFVPGLLLMAAAAMPGTPEPAPGLSPAGVNVSMPVFNAKGYRDYGLIGSRITPVGETRWDVTDMRLVHYAGDAKSTIETIVIAAQASFLKEGKIASGQNGVRVIRDDLEVSGELWTYNHSQETLVVENNVEVTIHAVLPAILQ